jgi:hypothetical protein
VRAGKQEVIQEITAAGFRLIDDKPLLRTNYYLVFSKMDKDALWPMGRSISHLHALDHVQAEAAHL